MNCQSCGHENPIANRFCGACGDPLARSCPSCRHTNPPDHRFCGACGASLVAGSGDRADARQVVTIIFADLIGSTSLHERLDAESTRRLMDRYYRALRGAVDIHGGTVVKLMGDGVMAAFGVPHVAEDDAIRAVRAGLAMQHAFRTLADEQSAAVGQLGLRVGINTGEVVVSADNADIVGDPVNVAARLQQEAGDGDVVIGEATRRLVRDLLTLAPLGAVTLKGRSESMAAYRVVSLDRPVGAAATAFVGRDDELRRIMEVYTAAVAAPGARLAVVLGSPGLGKSRLIEEFARRLGDGATALTAHCEVAGGATFAPIAKALRALLRIDEGASGPSNDEPETDPANEFAATKGTKSPGGDSPHPAVREFDTGRGGEPTQVGLVLSSPRFQPPGGESSGSTARGRVLQLPDSGDVLRAAVAAAVPIGDSEQARIVTGITALLAGTPASPEEMFFVIRRFLAALAAVQPVVLAIDDLQWAEPLLLDLIEHLIQWSKDVPLLVLAAARPELRDMRSSLAAPGGLVHEVVTLAGLDAGAATRLAANAIGAGELPAALAGRVLAASEGNPLFVGELVRMLVHDGTLKREGDRWTAGVDLAALDMPPTIHALLAARIERLRAEERLVLERAAVVGRQFSRAAVAHLLPREVTDLDTRLEALRRSELIEPDTGWFLGEPALRFHHGLTRDAAYRRVLKGTRAELHGRCADWIESRVGEAIEHDETIGWHLEQAHQHLRELGPIDAPGRAVGERAARYLAAAGRRALARDDLLPAANLLGRALDRLDLADPTRADLAIDWCEALLAAGDVGPAAKAIAELGRFIGDTTPSGSLPLKKGGQEGFVNGSFEQIPLDPPFSKGEGQNSDRLRAWHTCFTGQLAVLTDPQALHATSDAVAAAAEELAEAGDAAGEAKGHFVHATALMRLGKIGACEAALDKALAAARRADDRRRVNAVLAVAPLAALWGPSPVTRASGRCLDVVRVLRITQGAPAVEAVALRCQAVLEALRGRADAARRMIASSRRMVEELGITQGLLETEMFAGLIELIEGDTAGAEHHLRAAYDGLRTHGLGIDAARAAALLGITLLAQGRAAEAEALSHESEALAGDDLQAAITWRRVRAEALARRGEHAAAVDFARAAVDIAAATDALLHHADARLALAVALRAAGRRDDAGAAGDEARAIELWEAKGATVLADRARLRPEASGGRARRGAGRVNQLDRSPDDRGVTVPVRRRVRANAATASLARFDAAMAARDLDEIAAHGGTGEVIDHSTGTIYDGQAMLPAWLSLVRAQDGTYRNEPLASLGDSLALCRQWASASALAGAKFDVGAYEIETVLLTEVDAQGQRRRTEVFAADRLGDAVSRLYERYAELLPDGPERARATATARSVAIILGPLEPDRWPFAPVIEFVDHRTVGLGSVHGAQALRQGIRALLDLSEDFVTRLDDVLALRPDALLVRWTNFGTDRASGGAFERDLCQVLVFGRDGLVTRWEQRDAERDAEALARFDELTGGAREPLPRPLSEAERGADLPPSLAGKGARGLGFKRRVRPNAATANEARLVTAMAARDGDALPDLFADGMEAVHHPTGLVFDKEGNLSSLRTLLESDTPRFGIDSLATLGDSLCLSRNTVAATSATAGTLELGAFEAELVVLYEVDEHGRGRRLEFFAANRLGDAVARLYERYAELLPEGPARVRAAATTRSVAALLGPPDRWPFTPDAEATDHRTVGFGSVRGGDAVLQAIRALLQLSDDFTSRIDDVLGLRSDALLVRWTTVGTVRVSGGPFERNALMLWVFGADGLLTRWEQFEADRDAEALARFDELTGEAQEPLPRPLSETERGGFPPSLARKGARGLGFTRRVRPNAVTANIAHLDAAMAARDADALPALLADDHEGTEHTTGDRYDKDATLAAFHSFLRAQDLRYEHQPLATLGSSLALFRSFISGSGVAGTKFDVGAYETETVVLREVDAQGRLRRTDLFPANRLGDAAVRLYERYADLLPDGPARVRAAATVRSVAAWLGPFDLARYATALAPAVEFADHRPLGFPPTIGPEAYLRRLRSLLEVADDINNRADDILDLRPDALLVRWTNFGTDRAGGGAYERHFLFVGIFGNSGLLTRMEVFDAERDAEALARFDELTGDTWGESVESLASRPSRRRQEKAAPQGERKSIGDSGSNDSQTVRAEALEARPEPGRRARSSTLSRAAEQRARRVRANAATANAARTDTAIAARDADALPSLFTDDLEVVDHTTGVTFDRHGGLSSFRALMSAQAPTRRQEPLATLGDSLALSRVLTSATGFAGRTFDVGAYEREEIVLIEVDANGRRRRIDIFALDRLGDAVARLYERYADLLPDGLSADTSAGGLRSAGGFGPQADPARTRAAATARSVAALIGLLDFDRYAARLAPDVEYVDHRPLGFPPTSGIEAYLRRLSTLREVSDDSVLRADDVLGLRSDALLVRCTNFGTDRTGGGTFERHFLMLWAFGTDGLVTHHEMFEVGRDAEALARFDELVAAPPEPLPRPLSEAERGAHLPHSLAGKGARGLGFTRRVRPNAATEYTARLDAAFAARDAAALDNLVGNDAEVVHHPTGVTYDRSGVLATIRMGLRAQGLSIAHEPLATLGESLALCRRLISASGTTGRTFDVGDYESDLLVVSEVGEDSRSRRAEFFAADHLGDAVARLYERYADLLPDGPARARAAATARSIAALLGSLDDLDRYATALTPTIEVVDHRILGTWSARGPEEVLQHNRSLLELVDHMVIRVDEVLGLQSDALLVRQTNCGTDRASGGAYERLFLVLWLFGTDGLLSRWEFYDAERDAEALARFDELAAEPSTAAPATTHITNAATRSMHNIKDALEARDWERVAAVLAPEFRYFDRRTMMHLDLDRDQYIEFQRPNWQMSSARVTQEVLATRGNRLALFRAHFEGSDHTIGPSEIEFLCVAEVNDRGVRVATVMFDPDDLDAAYAELDDRYAAGEAAPYAPGAAGRAVAAAFAARDWDSLAAVFAPDLVVNDHRPLGWPTLHGPAQLIDSFKALVELAPDVRLRIDHVVASATGSLSMIALVGTREGGAFEDLRVIVHEFDANGSIRRQDVWNVEQFDEARARFEAIGAGAEADLSRGRHARNFQAGIEEHRMDSRLQTAGMTEESASASVFGKERTTEGSVSDPRAALAPLAELRRDPLQIPPNAATRAIERWQEVFDAQDWDTLGALYAPALVFDDRRHLTRTTGDRDMAVANSRLVGESGARASRAVLATSGDRLALQRLNWTGADDRLIFEVEVLELVEIDAEGRIVAVITFDPDERRAASAEMLERYARSDAARCIPAAVFEVARAMRDHDLARMRAALPDDFFFHDHRRTGIGRLGSADDYVASMAALYELSPDVMPDTLYHIVVEKHGSVSVGSTVGMLSEGGEFESVFVRLILHQGDRFVGSELFELEDLDAARARFEELRPDSIRIPPNAACRVRDRTLTVFEARDSQSLRSLAAGGFTFEDRRKRVLLAGDVELWIKHGDSVLSMHARHARELIGTVGDRIALERVVWAGDPDNGAFEIEFIRLIEIDADGRLAAWIYFDLDDRRAAFAEANARFEAGEAAALGGGTSIFVAFRNAFMQHDWETLRGCLADHFVFHDHRTLGLGALGRDEWIASLRILGDLAPDVGGEGLRVLAWNRHGRVQVARQFGTMRDGGPFESVFIRIIVAHGDRIECNEIFDVGDADQALARFAELCVERE